MKVTFEGSLEDIRKEMFVFLENYKPYKTPLVVSKTLNKNKNKNKNKIALTDTVIHNLYQARIIGGFNQMEMGLYVNAENLTYGSAQMFVSRYETGKTKFLSVEVITKAASLVDLELGDFVSMRINQSNDKDRAA